MRKIFAFTATFAAVGMLLSGCGSSGSGGGSDGTLVVYTNSNSDGRAEWLTDQAAEAGHSIKVVGAGGGETTNKLIAEKGNAVADVVFGLNNMYLEQLKEAETLEPYTPAWSKEVDPAKGDQGDEKTYFPIVEQGITLAYDADKYSESEAPQQWSDLWTEERFHERYETPDTVSAATTQLVFASILSQYKDDSGDLGISAKGWKQIEAFFDNGVTHVVGTDLYARIADDELDMGQMATSSIPAFEKQYEVNSKVMTPEYGVPYAIEQVAIVKGTEQKEQAQEFVDWFGSAKVQSAWSDEFNTLPVNEEAVKETDPEIVKVYENLDHQDIDWAFTSEHMGDWAEKISLEYVK